MVGEGSEAGEQYVGHSRGLHMLPEPLDEIEFRTVVRQPEDLQMFFDIFQIARQRPGMVRRALIHHHDDPSAGPSRPTHQLLQEDLHAPSGLTRLHMRDEQPASVAERPKNCLLAVDPGRVNPQLVPTTHPGTRQMRMQMKLRLVLVPQFVVGVSV